MASLFTKIINRELPAHFLYEDEVCIAILDKFPRAEGQTLVIPRKEVDYIFDLDEETYQHLWRVTQKTAKALDKTFKTERTCIVVEGFVVPHTHIRLYPVKEKELDTRMGTPADDAALANIAERIKENF